MKKRVLTTILSVILILAMASCGSSKSDNTAPSRSYYGSAQAETYYDYSEAEMYDMSAAEMPMSYNSKSMMDITATAAGDNIADTRKIIKNVSMTLEALEFDKAVEDIKATALSQGGYIENSYVSGRSINQEYNQRYASFSIRVPADKLSAYVNTLNETYNLLNINESSSDITDQYYDTEARLKSLVTQEERLLSMLEGATELQYMLDVERNLADVRYQIENYYSTLTRYDNQVSMSTVTIELQEVVKYQEITEPPKTFGQRLGSAIAGSWNNFVYGLQDFVIDFTYALPGLLVFCVIVGFIVFIIVSSVKRRRKKKSLKNEETPD